jgi:hypothetical protein
MNYETEAQEIIVPEDGRDVSGEDWDIYLSNSSALPVFGSVSNFDRPFQAERLFPNERDEFFERRLIAMMMYVVRDEVGMGLCQMTQIRFVSSLYGNSRNIHQMHSRIDRIGATR